MFFYHSKVNLTIVLLGATNFSNFAYEVQVTLVQGDRAGTIFRVDDTNHTFYFFGIDNQGNYVLDIHNQNSSITLKSGTNSAINTTADQANVLGVVANGSQIDLYMNRQKIDSVTDTTLSQGVVGVAVYDSTNPTSATFTNAKVWTF